jgi:murein DD-endopeptidase MepM/ murein hydrolase activator NlpD
MIFNLCKRMYRLKRVFSTVTVCCICVFVSCSSKYVVHESEKCYNYPEPRSSRYILPYEAGEAHPVIQGNCAPNEYPWTHYGKMSFAYDFGMPIGTKIIAARSGTVVFVRDQFTDNDHGRNQGNAIVVLQGDGSYALYAHITHNGSKVRVGQIVKQGDTIALSGNSGETPTPHLHFQVNECGDFTKCASMPISFRNARPNTGRLERGKSYSAE